MKNVDDEGKECAVRGETKIYVICMKCGLSIIASSFIKLKRQRQRQRRRQEQQQRDQ